MSRDIRSFFNVISKHTNGNSNRPKEIKSKKAKPAVIDSDDDDVIKSTPEQNRSKATVSKRKHVVISSDSEEDSKHKVKSPVKKNKAAAVELKAVNIDDVFGNTPIKQSKVEFVPKTETVKSKTPEKKHKKSRKPKTELGVHNDEDFEKTLLELDDDILLQNVDILDKTVEEALHKEEANTSDKKPKHDEKKRQRKSSSDGTPNKKPKLEHSDSGIDPDQEAFEKRRYSAMLYQKYKNRGGPKHHGEKEIPQGKPDCLKNLTFLRTGVLDSLESNEFDNLVKEHGGRVVHAVSKKVNYLVVGDDPGPAKLDKARGFNIPEISEDDLLDMILVKSGMKPKFSKTRSNVSSESGIATEEETSPKSKKREKSPKHKKEEQKKAIKHESQKSVEESSNHSEKSESKPNLKQLSNIKSSSSKTNISHKSKDEKVSIKKEALSPSSKSKPEHKKTVKAEPKPEIESQKDIPKAEIASSDMTWTEKYKPKDIKSIIGQQGDSSNMNKLKKWLQNWYRNQQPEVHKKIPRPSPWAKNDDGAYYKAALLSGPPGVGKTTTATLISKELGFDVVEFNASDTRSKKLLHEEVSQLLSTNTIAGFAAGKKTTDKKRVLLMDEVDGMAGNEDRGGIQELINLIKNSSIPIICMCNDRNHQKMRSLVNYCFDLRFSKPRLEQIRGAMMSICFKEGLDISPNALTELIQGTGCDIRQTLNNLSMWTSADKSLSVETAQKEAKASKKDTVLGPWEVVRMVFSKEEQKDMSVSDKSRLFFYDYSLGPLFVQENYLSVAPSCDKKDFIKRAALAADAISMGDLIDSRIRRANNWALLETQAIFSSVLPGFYMSGHVTHRINFPGWLGKNSSANKHKRMLCELYAHTRTTTSGNRLALKLDYLVPLRNAIIAPLKKYGTEGVHEAIEVMKSYNLLREDFNNLIELCQWKNKSNPFNDIDAKVKSAFTRIYNKEAPLLPFAASGGVAKKKVPIEENELLDEEELAESDHEDKDDVTTDAMIKVKTKTDSKSKKQPKASSNKTKESSKGAKGKGKKTK